MQCPNCRREIERGWNYCPGCGARFRRDFFSSVFDRMFSSMNKEIRQMDRLMEKNIEALDLSPFFRQKPRGSGFTIKIRRAANSPPRISVRTFGNVDRERVREQVREQLGNLGFKGAVPAKSPERPKHQEKPPIMEPKSIEEPKADVKRLDGRVVVNLEMPGVKSPDDIDVKELESSLEVKATAGDKAYFKILTKPGRFRLTKKSFSRGILHLEFS